MTRVAWFDVSAGAVDDVIVHEVEDEATEAAIDLVTGRPTEVFKL